jgi:hypothetical protein
MDSASSSPAAALAIAAHVKVHLIKKDVPDARPMALLLQLAEMHCLLLSSTEEDKLRRKQHSQGNDIHQTTTVGASASASAAAAAVSSLDTDEMKDTYDDDDTANIDKHNSTSVCKFEPTDVIIMDMSVSPPREVDAIDAFGLRWRPVGPRKSAVGASSSSKEVLKPFDSLATTTEGQQLVQFFSMEHALFSAPPSAALAAHHQRLKQLPMALESNKAHMNAAMKNGEINDVGALYVERKRLKEELHRMKTHIPPEADIIEVRDTFCLPLGVAMIDKHMYFLQRNTIDSVRHRQLAAVQIHEGSHFNATPFGTHTKQLAVGTSILTQQHMSALLRLFDGQTPSMQLLWSGKRDGMTPADFHRHCDNKGPTFTVIRTTTGRIFGGWAGESWNKSGGQYAASTWLFTFGLAIDSHPVSKYQALSTAAGQAMYGISSCGPAFGPDGWGLAANITAGNSAKLKGYKLQEGYNKQPGGKEEDLGGEYGWTIDEIEVWTCPLQVTANKV